MYLKYALHALTVYHTDSFTVLDKNHMCTEFHFMSERAADFS